MLLQTALFSSLLLVAILATLAIKRIPEGQVHSLYRFGRPLRMLAPGIHVVLPLVDRVAHKISLNGHALRLAESVALDAAGTHRVEGLVYWQVLEPERADEVIDDAENLILRNALDALRDAPELAAEAVATRNARLKQALNQHLRPRGMLVTRVDLQLAA